MMVFDKRQVAGMVWEQRGIWREPVVCQGAEKIQIETSHGYEVVLDKYDIGVFRKAIVAFDNAEVK